MKKRKLKKKIEHRIYLYEEEIADSVDTLKLAFRNENFTYIQILKTAKEIKYYQRKIDTLKDIKSTLNLTKRKQ